MLGLAFLGLALAFDLSLELTVVLGAVDVARRAIEADVRVLPVDLVRPLAQIVPTGDRGLAGRPPPLRLGGDATAGLDRPLVGPFLLALAATIRLGPFSFALFGRSGGGLRVPPGRRGDG
jgi:hypothetical protein